MRNIAIERSDGCKNNWPNSLADKRQSSPRPKSTLAKYKNDQFK